MNHTRQNYLLVSMFVILLFLIAPALDNYKEMKLYPSMPAYCKLCSCSSRVTALSLRHPQPPERQLNLLVLGSRL